MNRVPQNTRRFMVIVHFIVLLGTGQCVKWIEWENISFKKINFSLSGLSHYSTCSELSTRSAQEI